MAEWLSFTPARNHTRNGNPAVGAHAFDEGSLSLCSYASREKAGGPASATARRCVWCERVLGGISLKPIFGGGG